MNVGSRKKLMLFLQIIFVVSIGSLFVNAAFSQNLEKRPCKQLPDGVSRKQLEDDFEKFKKGEGVILDSGPLGCLEALPVLKKYALDPDPKVRAIVTLYLGTSYYDFNIRYYPQVLELLLQQIGNFPLDKSTFPPYYAAQYPCYLFKKNNNNGLADALIKRIRNRDKEFNRDEIYLLSCLSRHEPKAKDFLQEMRQPTFQTQLSETEREDQRNILTYALAEAGLSEAEEKVLAEFEAQASVADPEKIQSILNYIKSFTNCRITERFVNLILDEREITKSDDQKGQIKIRIGDLAISALTDIYGTNATGEKDRFLRSHTTAETKKIYRRIRSFVKQKVSDSCGSQNFKNGMSN